MKQTFLFSPEELKSLVCNQERKPAKMVFFSDEPDFGDIYDGYEDFNVCSHSWC